MALTIRELADAAGVKVATIRYYERRGILPHPPRTPSGYRQYPASAVDRIRFIKRAQNLGFTLDEIEDLLELRVTDRSSCAAVEEAARAKLDDVAGRIRELERLRVILNSLVMSCRRRQPTEECPILALLDEKGVA